MTITDLALIAALFLICAVLPSAVDELMSNRIEQVECLPLKMGEHQVRLVRADGRTKLMCKTQIAEK